ncbi:MAG: LysR family transcriptional regulator [Alphaproteobacteria bacterium]|nr:LysR family transcriptional regulator [Alphaproteobacteria bacterium]
MDLDLYRGFLRAVEQGSITAAARSLGVSRPTLSRQISALEEELGLALLHRSTRTLTLTPSGRQLVEALRPLVQELERLEGRLKAQRDEASGLLRVSAPPVLAPALSLLLLELRRAHPDLRVELDADIRWVELRSDDVDVAVRAGRLRDPDLVQRSLGSADISALASPDYLARRAPPRSAAELSEHVLLLGQGQDGHPQAAWPLREGGYVAVDSGFCCNDQRALLEAALAGEGLALLSTVTAGPALAEGRLLRVLPAELGTRLPLHAVYARRKLQPARVRVFVDALVDWARALEPSL